MALLASSPAFSRRAPAPNMTPMVDVVMVILVFYMASASLGGLELFKEVAVPRVGAGESPTGGDPFALPPVTFTLRLSHDGSRTTYAGVGDNGGTLSELESALASLATDATGGMELLISPEANVPYQDVVVVCDICERAGVEKIGLLPHGQP